MDITQQWATTVTGPLRAVRRALKTPPPQAAGDDAAALRCKIGEDERAAERIEQTMLEALTRSNLAARDGAGEPSIAARKALSAYVRLAGAARSPQFSVSLLEDLIGLSFGPLESGADARGMNNA